MEGSTSTSSGDGVAYRALLSDPRLLTVTMLSVVGTLGTNVASPALPAMSGALGVSDARVGLVITAYTLPAMFVVPVVGVLADTYGRRTVVVPSLAVFGLAGSAVGLVHSFEAVLLLRGVQGIAFAGIMPMSVTILGDLYEGATGSAAQGVRVGMNGISTTLVPAIAGALSALSWNYPFLLYAIAVPAAVVTYAVLPETTSGIEVTGGVLGQLGRYARTLRGELGDVRLSSLLVAAGVRDFVRYGLIVYVPLFAVGSLDASFAQAGALLSVRGVSYILFAPLSGAIVGRVSQRWALVGAILFGAACMALLPAAPGLLWVGALVLLYSVGDSIFSPVVKGAVTDSTGEESRAGIVAGMNVLKYAAQTASPAFFGLVLAASGFDAVFEIGAAIAAGYALFLVFVLESG